MARATKNREGTTRLDAEIQYVPSMPRGSRAYTTRNRYPVPKYSPHTRRNRQAEAAYMAEMRATAAMRKDQKWDQKK